MRICSLLPGATEIAFALGLGDHIVGVTHECDYPADAKNKPVIVRGVIDPSRMSSREIDHKIGELLQGGKGLYSIDERAFVDASPDIILTQGLCDVCALDYDDVVKAAQLLPRAPKILSLDPHNLADILEDIRRIGAITERDDAAEKLIRELSGRVQRVGYSEPSYRPRVVCLEWFEPLYTAGHWVPEMVALAGGLDVLGHKGKASSKVTWQEVVDARPDIILLMPCGFDARRTIRESTPLRLSTVGMSSRPSSRQRFCAQRQCLLQPPRPPVNQWLGNTCPDHSAGANHRHFGTRGYYSITVILRV